MNPVKAVEEADKARKNSLNAFNLLMEEYKKISETPCIYCKVEKQEKHLETCREGILLAALKSLIDAYVLAQKASYLSGYL